MQRFHSHFVRGLSPTLVHSILRMMERHSVSQMSLDSSKYARNSKYVTVTQNASISIQTFFNSCFGSVAFSRIMFSQSARVG